MDILLRAGANTQIVSPKCGTVRQLAARKEHIEVLRAIDRCVCRRALHELCIGLRATDFPVLVVLEIHSALCALRGLHEAELGRRRERRWLREGHLKSSVAWEIAKAVKHFASE